MPPPRSPAYLPEAATETTFSRQAVAVLLLLFFAYLLLGTLAHDPWKANDDAIHVGVAWEFASNGHWLQPRLAGEAWFGSPPLFHWIAAILGKIFGGIFGFHNAARLASLLFGITLLITLAKTSQRLHKTTTPWSAPLLAIGTLGLLLPLHDTQPLNALLAAQALMFLGLSIIPEKPLKGGTITGLALALSLWVSGSYALPVLLPILLLAPLHSAWRGKSLPGIMLAIGLGLMLGSAWLALVAWQTPEQLPLWLKAEQEKIAYFGWRSNAIRDHFEMLSWSVWPVFPIAAWACWALRKQLFSASLFLPLLGSTLALLEVFLFNEPRPAHHLMLIVPLTLLAVPGVSKLKRGATAAFDWFGMMTFSLIGGILWLGGISIMTGYPARVAKNFTHPAPGFTSEIYVGGLLIALLASSLWIWSLIKLPRTPWRSTLHWAGGLTLMWSLTVSFLLPWVDYGNTYRLVAHDLSTAIKDAGFDANTSCIASRNVGEGQRASLHYFIGLPSHTGKAAEARCELLLVQSGRKLTLPANRSLIWEGHRPGDTGEKFSLFAKEAAHR